MPTISVVLPCYRAAPEAFRSMNVLMQHFTKASVDWEVIVVDDGGHDFNAHNWPTDSRFRLIQFPENRGKGAAVQAGMLAARGDVRIFTDVDLPYGTASIPLMTEYILTRGFHVTIGDRTLPESTYTQQVSYGRRIASALFSSFAGRVVTGGFFDTQCGLKGFRGDVATSLFSLIRLARFTFDVELIYLCLHYKLDIKRLPVQLQRNTASSVRLWRDSLQGLYDIARIKHYQLSGKYRDSALVSIASRDLAALTNEVYTRSSMTRRDDMF